MDYYQILNVAPEANPDEIKKQYRLLVRENHPDIARDKEAAHAKMQVILEAYQVLSNVDSRAYYDQGRAKEARKFNGSVDGERRSYSSSSGGAVPEVVRRARAAQNLRQNRDEGGRLHNPRTRLLNMVFEAAQLYFFQERASDAIEMCKRVLKIDPKNAEAAALLGDIYLAQDRKDLALLMFEQAMRAQPSNLLYRQKWNAMRRGEPVPASPFARPPAPSEAASPSDDAVPDAELVTSNGAAAAAPPVAPIKPRLDLQPASIGAPAPRQSVLKKWFGRD